MSLLYKFNLPSSLPTAIEFILYLFVFIGHTDEAFISILPFENIHFDISSV